MPVGGVGTASVSLLAQQAYVWTIHPTGRQALRDVGRADAARHATSSQVPAAAAGAAAYAALARSHCNQFDPRPLCKGFA